MDPLTILAIAHQCAKAAPAVIVATVALLSTGGNPNAVDSAAGDAGSISIEEAVQAASSAAENKGNPTIGLALIPLREFSARSLSISEGLSPCTNLKVAAELVRKHYDAINGSNDADWRRAAIRFGVASVHGQKVSEYGARFDAARREIDAATRLIDQSGRAFVRAPAPFLIPALASLASSP